MIGMVKSPLRRGASRSALVKLSAPKGGGIGRVVVSRAAFLASNLKQSRQIAFQRAGFVLILLVMLKLGLIHTRLDGLRAANSSLPVGVLSVASVSLSSVLLCLVHLSRVSRQGFAWRVGGCLGLVFCSSFLFSLCLSLAVNLLCSAWLLSSLLPLGR